MKTLWLLALAVALGLPGRSQDAAAKPNLVAQMQEMLQRSASGHSPTTEEIQAVEGAPGLTDPAVAKALVPLLTQALANSDAAMRGYALAMLVGMQSLPEAPAADGTVPAPATKAAPGTTPTAGPAAYKADVAEALVPAVAAIAARLTDDDPQNRGLTATVLGGFSPDPPPAVYPPLLTYLKRDDATGAVALAVVTDLLQIGPVSDETAAEIARYLRRTDLTPDAQANLVEAIAGRPNQNQAVDKALLSYLDSDDANLRARVILSLPQLNLAPELFADTKARVAGIASGGQDSLADVNAAKAVARCWTQVKMTTGCPQY
jgi:hypothetical protein